MSDAPPSVELAIDLGQSKVVLDRLLGTSTNAVELGGAYYLRARGFEEGRFPGGVNLDAALLDFRSAAKSGTTIASRAVLGCARVLFLQDAAKNAEVAAKCCVRAIEIDSNSKAMMLLGQIEERVRGNPEKAAEWYLRAFRQGLPWGLRFYARLKIRTGDLVLGVLSHIAASICGVYLVFKYGRSSPFT